MGSANYTPKQRTIAILSYHTFRYLQQLQRNLDSLYNNSLMLVGGKTKRCRDNKRDTAAKPVEVASRMVQNLPQMTLRFTVGDLKGSKKSNEIVSFGQKNYMESIPTKAFSS